MVEHRKTHHLSQQGRLRTWVFKLKLILFVKLSCCNWLCVCCNFSLGRICLHFHILFELHLQFCLLLSFACFCILYLSKWQNISIKIAQYICQNCPVYLSKLLGKKYFSKLQNVFVQSAGYFVQLTKCICPQLAYNGLIRLCPISEVRLGLIRLSSGQKIFVQITKCIFSNY